MKSKGGSIEQLVREIALAYPETIEERPWGHPAIKVRGKAFVFMGTSDGRFGLSVKLPHSNEAALIFPFVEPTGYGLAKSGWISASFAEGDEPPMPLVRAWIDESYRAVAPKKLAALLDGGAAAAPVKPAKSRKPIAPKVAKPRAASTKKAAAPSAKKAAPPSDSANVAKTPKSTKTRSSTAGRRRA